MSYCTFNINITWIRGHSQHNPSWMMQANTTRCRMNVCFKHLPSDAMFSSPCKAQVCPKRSGKEKAMGGGIFVTSCKPNLKGATSKKAISPKREVSDEEGSFRTQSVGFQTSVALTMTLVSSAVLLSLCHRVTTAVRCSTKLPARGSDFQGVMAC